MSNYRIAYDKGFDDLFQREPHDIAVFLHVDYCTETHCFTVPYFGEAYRVDCVNKTVSKCSDGSIPPIDDAILILHYLTFSQLPCEYTASGQWVSLKEIPNGGALFYPAFHKDAILALISAFGKDLRKFAEAVQGLHGVPSHMGDSSATFEAFL
jgi:hypothetical protein